MTQHTILYIEDNLDNRLLVKRVLEAEGYKVIEADGGMAGLKAEVTRPDLVLVH
jgi:two-component system cell cycle response regulator DivK